jgi:hypothetical protein
MFPIKIYFNYFLYINIFKMMQRTSKITDTVEDLKLAFRVFVIFLTYSPTI